MAFDSFQAQEIVRGQPFSVTKETIRAFGEATLDFNPLHFDDEFMQGNFGKTKFGGVIAHGFTSYGLIARMLTEWGYPSGGQLRRMEARWVAPVRPGDVVMPSAVVRDKKVTARSRWVTLDVEIKNQRLETVARGEALMEFSVEAGA